MVDHFHAVALANAAIDDVRRRVQNETLGHRGRKGDPLYAIRRLLLRSGGDLDERAWARPSISNRGLRVLRPLEAARLVRPRSSTVDPLQVIRGGPHHASSRRARKARRVNPITNHDPSAPNSPRSASPIGLQTHLDPLRR